MNGHHANNHECASRTLSKYIHYLLSGPEPKPSSTILSQCLKGYIVGQRSAQDTMDTARNEDCSSGKNSGKVAMKRVALEFTFSLVLASMALFAQSVDRTAQLPDDPGRETVKKICAACHPAELVLGKGMSREQWGGIVSNMISRGAKGTDAEFAQVVDYLAKNLPPHTDAQATTRKRGGGGGGLLAQAGPSDKHIVDDEAAERGKT